jgi:hypothetical protein
MILAEEMKTESFQQQDEVIFVARRNSTEDSRMSAWRGSSEFVLVFAEFILL